MRAACLDVGHYPGNGRSTVFGQAVHAAADQKVGTQILGQTVEFEDVALTIPDMNTAFGRACQFRGPTRANA